MYLILLQTSVGGAHVTFIGYSIADGLDGEKLYHVMHPHGGSVTVIGPEEDRAEFRETFLSRVEDVDILWADLAPMTAGEPEREAALAELKRQVDECTAEKRPTLLVIDRPTTDLAAMSYIVQLIEQMRWHNLSLYIEFDRIAASFATRCMVNSWTVVCVGPDAAQDARALKPSQSQYYPLGPGGGYISQEYGLPFVPVVFP